MKNIKKKIVLIFTYLFLALGVVVFLNCIFFNSTTQFKYNMMLSTIISIMLLIILLIIYFIYSSYIEGLDKNIRVTINIIGFLLLLCVQIYIVRNTYYSTGWDCGKIVNSAINLIDNQDAFDIMYFKRFPNNIFLLWIFKNIYLIICKFTNVNFWFVLDSINVLIIDISIILIVKTCKEIFETRSYIISKILSILLLAFSPWILIPYTDTFSIVIPICIFYVYVKIIRENNKIRKILDLVLIGVFFIIGYQLKPTNIIICIAIFIAHFLCRVNRKDELIKTIEALLIIILVCVSTKVIYNKCIADFEVNSVEVKNNEAEVVPMTHFLMMGMQSKEIDGGVIYGSWCQEDYDITLSKNSKSEKIEANVSEIKSRLKNFGVLDYTKFLYKKANWILCDGTFFYGGEGQFVVEGPYKKGLSSEKIQSYYLYNGENYDKMAHVNQAVWILILILIIVPIFKVENKNINVELFIVRLTIVGIVVFLLLFEARARYLINHLPFFIILATYGFEQLFLIIRRVKQNKHV